MPYVVLYLYISVIIGSHDGVFKWKHFPRYWPFVVTGEFPSQRPVTRSFDVFFDLRMNKRLSEQPWHWCLRHHRAHYDVTVLQILLLNAKL